MSEDINKAIEAADTAIEATKEVGRIMNEARFERLKDEVVKDINKSLDEHILTAIDNQLEGYRNAIFDLRNQVAHLIKMLNAVYQENGIVFDPPVYHFQQIETLTEDLKDKAIAIQFVKDENDVVNLQTYSYDNDERKDLDLTNNPMLYQAFTNEIKRESGNRFELDKEYYFLLSIVNNTPSEAKGHLTDEVEEIEA